MTQIRIRGTEVLDWNLNATTRIVVNQGGTGSSKTYSLLQLLIVKGLRERGKIFTIARKTFPALRATVMKDFFILLNEYGLYDERNHNKMGHSYNLNGNDYVFLSVDQAQKLRGRKHNYIYLNEANELSYEDFMQFNLRLRNPSYDGQENRIYLDYNPSDEYHWLYDKVLTREDCTFFQSTYLNNPFLEADTVRAIEELQQTDENYWRVYGLGERGISSSTIFTTFREVDSFPENIRYCYGLDFGYNAPSSVIKVGIQDNNLYWKQELYKSGLTTPDLIKELKRITAPNPRATIYADPSRPETIAEMELAGFKMGITRNEIYEGIQAIKGYKLHITKDSADLLKELRAYKWKTSKTGENLDEPIGLNDHAMDAARYGTYSQLKGVIRPARFNLSRSS